MRRSIVLLLALAGCAGPTIPAQDAQGKPTEIKDESTLAQAGGYALQGGCVVGIVAAGVVLMNPGAIGALGLCGGD